MIGVIHKIATTLSLSLSLSCSQAASQAAFSSGSPRPRTNHSGWAFFSSEMRLYARKEDIGKLYDKSCISGKFNKFASFNRAARRYHGKRVRVTGFLLGTEAYWSANPFGATIENYCNGDQILIAETIVADPEPTRALRRSGRKAGR